MKCDANHRTGIWRVALAAKPAALPWDSSTHAIEAATAAPARTSPSLAALLTGHILQDGEVILLILKPSLWFILLSSLRWLAAIAILLVAAKIYDDALPGKNVLYLEAGIFCMAGRVMFAVLQWMGRLYVLTDMRIVKLSGIFSPALFDCPLRKVAGTRVASRPASASCGSARSTSSPVIRIAAGRNGRRSPGPEKCTSKSSRRFSARSKAGCRTGRGEHSGSPRRNGEHRENQFVLKLSLTQHAPFLCHQHFADSYWSFRFFSVPSVSPW